MDNNNKKINREELDKKAKEYIKKTKQFAEDKDLKNEASNYLVKFKDGVMNLERTPVLIASFLIILILWVPMMYSTVTADIFTGRDAMSNKELNALQHRLEDRVKAWGEQK